MLSLSEPSEAKLYGQHPMVVSLNYCSQNGGNVYRDPHYNGNPNIGPRIIGNLDQYPYGGATGRGTALSLLLHPGPCPDMRRPSKPSNVRCSRRVQEKTMRTIC